jgi:hypothetical protein
MEVVHMQTLTREQCEAWCSANGLRLNSRRLPELPTDAERFEIPTDAQKRIALVVGAMNPFRRTQNFLIWFDDWSVWPSGQRMHVFERFRLSYGERRPLIEAPGQTFSSSEIEDGVSFVALAVLFLWDCYVIAPSDGGLLRFSHDEWGARSPAQASANQ